jgi:hypothetical protein
VLTKQSKTADDNKGQKPSKSAKNKGVTTSKAEDSAPPKTPAKVPVDDSTSTKNVRCSDKQNNKLSNKQAMDPDLTLVVEAWPELPEHIKAAIKALIQTHKAEKK